MRDVTSRDTPMLTAESVLSFTHVHKSFKSTTALSDVSLEVPRGTIVGLVGRNGCGKTTLLHHVTGLMLPMKVRVEARTSSPGPTPSSRRARCIAAVPLDKARQWGMPV